MLDQTNEVDTPVRNFGIDQHLFEKKWCTYQRSPSHKNNECLVQKGKSKRSGSGKISKSIKILTFVCYLLCVFMMLKVKNT